MKQVLMENKSLITLIITVVLTGLVTTFLERSGNQPERMMRIETLVEQMAKQQSDMKEHFASKGDLSVLEGRVVSLNEQFKTQSERRDLEMERLYHSILANQEAIKETRVEAKEN